MLALRPISSTRRGCAGIGRVPSFLSSTTDRSAADRAAARLDAVGSDQLPPLVDVGVVEQSERKLQPEHSADGVIDPADAQHFGCQCR